MNLIATLIDEKSHTFTGEVQVNFYFLKQVLSDAVLILFVIFLKIDMDFFCIQSWLVLFVFVDCFAS